jgi:hypothetical protein
MSVALPIQLPISYAKVANRTSGLQLPFHCSGSIDAIQQGRRRDDTADRDRLCIVVLQARSPCDWSQGALQRPIRGPVPLPNGSCHTTWPQASVLWWQARGPNRPQGWSHAGFAKPGYRYSSAGRRAPMQVSWNAYTARNRRENQGADPWTANARLPRRFISNAA